MCSLGQFFSMLGYILILPFAPFDLNFDISVEREETNDGKITNFGTRDVIECRGVHVISIYVTLFICSC